MKRKDMYTDSARSRVEAMADGSLKGDERRRMRDAMRGDPALRAAVERAGHVRAGLRQLRTAPVPAGLLRRLLAVPGRSPRRPMVWSLIALPVAAAIVAAVTALIVSRPATETVAEDQQQMAVRDFSLAMSYLQKSAAYAGNEVSGIVGAGLLTALTASRDSLLHEESDDDNGG